jgi:hypothetical protein
VGFRINVLASGPGDPASERKRSASAIFLKGAIMKRLVMVLCVGSVVAASLGFGLGYLVFSGGPKADKDLVKPSPAVKEPSPAAALPPRTEGARIGDLRDTVPSNGRQVVAFEYTGGHLGFWSDIESDGKKTAPLSGIGPDRFWFTDGPVGVVDGEFVWTRATADTAKPNQTWWVAHRGDFVAEREQAFHGTAYDLPVTAVWKTKTPARVRGEIVQLVTSPALPSISGLATFVTALMSAAAPLSVRSSEVDIVIPSPLPLDQDVCVKEIHEELWQGNYPVDKHVIRVMCKVISVNDKATAAVFSGRGSVFYGRKQYGKAISAYEAAINLDPKHADACNGFAWLRATCPNALYRDGKKAVELAHKACVLTAWNNADDIDTLAAAWAEAGDFAQAVKYQKQALEFPIFQNRAGPAELSRLKLFKQKQPYRQ